MSMTTIRISALLGVLLGWAGLAHAQEAHGSVKLTTAGVAPLVAVGMRLGVQTSWDGSCPPDAMDQLLSKSGTATAHTCNARSYSIRVQCSSRCAVVDDAGHPATLHAEGWKNFSVVPLELGPLSVTVTLTAVGSGAPVEESAKWLVRAPDDVSLYCAALGNRRNYAPSPRRGGFARPCEGQVIHPRLPLVLPVAEFNGERYFLHGASLNGRSDWPDHELRLGAIYPDAKSLADLFPQGAVDGRPARGERRVTVEVGGVSRVIPLDVEGSE
jgi:hypothetical protein